MSDLPTYDEALALAALRANDADGATKGEVLAIATLSLAWTALARELREGAAKADVLDDDGDYAGYDDCPASPEGWACELSPGHSGRHECKDGEIGWMAWR
jgi:hypothetical protein